MSGERGSVRVVEGVLQAGAALTPCARAGCGGAVLLLRDLPAAELAACRVLAELAEGFRVTAAAPPPARDAGWLRDLIDGLGLDRPCLVVDAALAPFARDFAAGHPERVRGVSVLGSAGEVPGDALDRVRRDTGAGAREGAPRD